MKQSEIKNGESYLFYQTCVEHRKNMVGTIVTICGGKTGNKKYNFSGGVLTGVGKKPKRFRLTNGQYANAGELKEINYHTMQIEVTGCNNCPFRYIDYYYGEEYEYSCAYDMNNDNEEAVYMKGENFFDCRTDIPHNCPITLNGGTITVTTKTQ